MSIHRRIIYIASGAVSSEIWREAAREEAPVHGRPSACGPCPLRVGGEWEAGATAALAEMPDGDRAEMKRWGCHERDVPCAGMRRLLKGAR